MILDEDTFNRLKQRLSVDPMRLTEELMEMPQLQQSASEGATEAQRVLDEAKNALEMAEAEAAASIRDIDSKAMEINPKVKPRSETQIKSEILLDDQVRQAMDTLRNATYDLGMWKSISDGMRTKTKSIDVISSLIQAGYTTPQSLYTERRRNIDTQRQLRTRGG